MQITFFSILMTFFWSSVLIALFYLLRKKFALLDVCGITGIIILYIFCMVRMFLPIEFPWTKIITNDSLYNWLYSLLWCELLNVFDKKIFIYQIILFIWVFMTLYFLVKYLVQYIRIASYFDSLKASDDLEMIGVLNEIQQKAKRKQKIFLVKTAVVRVPCCIGIFKKRIIIPDKEYSCDELYYIILHEYSHLINNDMLLKILTNIICFVYWWNPFVYLLKKDLTQGMEIRCDQLVVGQLNIKRRSEYLQVLFKEFCASGKEEGAKKDPTVIMQLMENHSQSLIERFEIVADVKKKTDKFMNLLVCIAAIGILIISYSFIIQSKFDPPKAEIEEKRGYEVNELNSYILIGENGRYYLVSEEGKLEINDEEVQFLINNGFAIKEE